MIYFEPRDSWFTYAYILYSFFCSWTLYSTLFTCWYGLFNSMDHIKFGWNVYTASQWSNMSVIASQFIGESNVCSITYSVEKQKQRKRQIFSLLAKCGGGGGGVGGGSTGGYSYVVGLVQKRGNSIANALELHLSSTNQSIWSII